MPIRLNLMAEALAAEQLRRQDPVKRAAVGGVVAAALMLMWSSSLQVKVMLAKGDLLRSEQAVNSKTNEYRVVLDNQRKITEVREKVGALLQLATNRFLNATMLNALQQTVVEDVQLLHLRLDQSYTALGPAPAPAPHPRGPDDRPPPPSRGTVAEHITLFLDAMDCSTNPGDQINKFKASVATNSYFHDKLEKTNAISLKSYSAPQVSPATGKSCVLFTLECRFQDNVR